MGNQAPCALPRLTSAGLETWPLPSLVEPQILFIRRSQDTRCRGPLPVYIYMHPGALPVLRVLLPSKISSDATSPEPPLSRFPLPPSRTTSAALPGEAWMPSGGLLRRTFIVFVRYSYSMHLTRPCWVARALLASHGHCFRGVCIC